MGSGIFIMKHRRITFFFLFLLGFSFNLIILTFSEAARVWACKKNASSTLILRDVEVRPFNLTDGSNTINNQCSEQPNFYKIL